LFAGGSAVIVLKARNTSEEAPHSGEASRIPVLLATMDASYDGLSIRDLKKRCEAQGVMPLGSVEKSDLVAALRNADQRRVSDVSSHPDTTAGGGVLGAVEPAASINAATAATMSGHTLSKSGGGGTAVTSATDFVEDAAAVAARRDKVNGKKPVMSSDDRPTNPGDEDGREKYNPSEREKSPEDFTSGDSGNGGGDMAIL